MKKIAAAQLKVGMFVVNAGLSWMDYPYLYQEEGELTSSEQIDAILEGGYAEVFVDPGRGSYLGLKDEGPLEDSLLGHADSLSGTQLKKINLVEEMGRARKIYADSLQFAREFLQGARMGYLVDYTQSERLVESVIDSVVRNEDAMVSLTKLRSFDEYSYTHSINVAVLAVAFGKNLGLPRDRLRALGSAGIFHDLGKSRIPEAILNKPGKLTAEEFEVMKSHPKFGFELLVQQGSASDQVLLGVLQHHEKFNGKGYPGGVSGNAISLLARIIAVADVYDALTSERVYKKGMMPYKALSLMYTMRGEDFHIGYVERFIKSMGIYPVGSFVRLSTREYAVVTGSNMAAPLFPQVTVVLTPGQRGCPPRELDLDAARNGGETIEIIECLNPRDFKIDPAAYLM
ncbi:HD-GYP domain-containing protein [Oceanidesulfovibrio marinus]|uniref:HD-GYP domain-containing protein n=1 Tax=Oceanidesulfovibrio marinus TaxID=370038 RepID=A0A6P1ZBC7_9BACT|nr:HD-GYP domain-containing protein [Oceanidesulfovibrio marinus]TVM30361.1 HD-GYP domain-containing protein [Oceanidesulfovibrio marinus]